MNSKEIKHIIEIKAASIDVFVAAGLFNDPLWKTDPERLVAFNRVLSWPGKRKISKEWQILSS